MRVIIVSNTSTYMVRFRSELMAELVRRGCDVIVISPHDEYPSDAQWPPVTRIELDLKQHGLNPLDDLTIVGRLTRTFARLKPSLVINYTLKPAIYGSLAARLARIPRVVSVFTGLGFWFTREANFRSTVGRLIRQALRFALRDNEKVFFQNPDDRNMFVDLGLVERRQTRIVDGSGVDTNYFAPSEAPRRSKEFLFLLMARLLEDKGIREFASAAAEIRRLYPHAQFNLLGPTDKNPGAIRRDEIDAWESSGTLRYLGEASDVRPHVWQSDVVVLPSYREGTPRSVLEAMAMGKPIITTDAPGCRETVVDGLNGFLVKPRDVSSLATAIKKFLLHPELVVAMGQESRRIAVTRYDVVKVNAVFLDNLL